MATFELERRKTPRLSLGPGFGARFMVGDRLVPDAELTNLSAGGCCLKVSADLGAELTVGDALEEFHFLHDDLPRGVLQARVRWVLGRIGRRCLVGVDFGPAPAGLGEALEAFVSTRLS